MAIVFISEFNDPDEWRAEFQRNLPDMDFRVWPDVGDPAEIAFAVVWQPEPGVLGTFPNLEAILSMGAGLDHLFGDPDLPAGVPIVRLVDPALTTDMTQYVVHWVVHLHRDFHRYPAFQEERRWKKLDYPEAAERRVGLLGLGKLGADAAGHVAALGFTVAGWSRTRKAIDGIESFHGADGLIPLLGRTDILVCLLPLTPATTGIINARTLAALPRGAFVVNAARGGLVVDEDLIAAIDSGHIAGAVLDVFQPEPLPTDHPFWSHPKVIVTPHTASHTTPRTAAIEMAEDIRRVRAGQPPRNVMGPDGY